MSIKVYLEMMYDVCFCREDYHAKKAEERKHFKAETKAKARQ